MSTRRTELPFANPIGDSFELMQKMWGFAGLPGIPGLPNAGNLASMAGRIPQQLTGMLAPTLDVGELEKRIADLRAVEQWLELNASILRTTIQSLEVQCATITTLKGISGAMVGPIFNRSTDLPKTPPEVQLGLEAMRAEESKAAHGRASMENSAPKAKPTAAKKSSASATPVAAMDPAAWWNTLQDQFARIAGAAGQSVVAPTPAKQRKRATKRRVAKSRG
ncbi:MAG: hypothetical protein H0V16_08030 [Burkholderiaceae bacterium]|nr:hypothetical protein [Burkholderiaceae bacterium]